MLALWLLKQVVADKLCFAGAHVALAATGVALANASDPLQYLANLALYTATFTALLLCVHHWNNLKITSGNGDGSNAGLDRRNSQVSTNVVSPPA